MAEGIVVEYGMDRTGLAANRPSNAPAGCFYWATDTEQLSISQGGNVWSDIGTPAGGVGGATITVGAESSNVINVSIQLEQPDGTDLATVAQVRAFLSDAATGIGLTAGVPDGGVAIGTDGAIIATHTASADWDLQSEADGDIDIDITDTTGTPTWYLVVVLPSGQYVISDPITFA